MTSVMEASMESITVVNGNKEEDPDKLVENPESLKHSIKNVNISSSQNGTDELSNTEMDFDEKPDTANEEIVKENGLNTDSPCGSRESYDEDSPKPAQFFALNSKENIVAEDKVGSDVSDGEEESMEVDQNVSDDELDESANKSAESDQLCSEAEATELVNDKNESGSESRIVEEISESEMEEEQLEKKVENEPLVSKQEDEQSTSKMEDEVLQTKTEGETLENKIEGEQSENKTEEQLENNIEDAGSEKKPEEESITEGDLANKETDEESQEASSATKNEVCNEKQKSTESPVIESVNNETPDNVTDVDKPPSDDAKSNECDQKKTEGEDSDIDSQSDGGKTTDVAGETKDDVATKEDEKVSAETEHKSDSEKDTSGDVAEEIKDIATKDDKKEDEDVSMKTDRKSDCGKEAKSDSGKEAKSNSGKEAKSDSGKVAEKQTQDDIKTNDGKKEDKNFSVETTKDTNVKSVDTLTDEDGSEFIITINEDDESGSEKEEDVKIISTPEKPKTNHAKDGGAVKTPVPIATKITVPYMGALGGPKTVQQHYIFPNTMQRPVVGQSTIIKTTTAPVQYFPIHMQSTAGTTQYMQSVVVAGKSVLVPASVANATKYVLDQSKSFTSNKSMIGSIGSVGKIPSITPTTSVKQGSGQKQETYSVKNGIETIERDIDLPLASWEMMDLIKWEVASHKPDNTFWMGLCNVNKKAELSAPSKFLFDLGSDIVKESAYKQITQVQTKKKEAGKLNDVEKENLEKMKKVVKELEDKLSHMALSQQKCNCGFQSESRTVMSFHKEHPHMDPPLNPHGLMTCAHCKFTTNDGTQYSFHMEAEHSMVGRVYSKPAFWQCGLCYYEHNSKNKLTNHRWKCMKHFKANQNQAPHHTDINYCLKNIYYKYQIKRPPPPKPQPLPLRHQHNTRTVIKPPTAIQPRNTTQGPLLTNHLQRPAVQISGVLQRPAAQVPSLAYGNQQAIALANIQNKNLTRFPLKNQNIRNPMQVVVRQPGTIKNTVNQLLMRAKTTNIAPPAKQLQQVVQKKLAPPPAKPATNPTFEVCEICGGYVKDRMSLRIHFFYAHKIDIPQHVFNRDIGPLLCEVCRARFWTTQGLSKHRAATKHNSTKQPAVTIAGDKTCWICHQKQENLYTHLLQFHQLNTAECMALRRCMFCGSVSNNRKDLEIHMAASHGVLIKGGNTPVNPTPKPAPAPKPATPKTVVVGPKTSVTTTGGKGAGLVRNNFCVFCCKQFADNTQLTLHCLSTHATCSSCGMVVAQNMDLKTHVCRSNTTRSCPICGHKNLKSGAYTKHVATHMKKCSVRVKRLTTKQIREASVRRAPLLPMSGTVVIDLRPPEDRKRSASEDGYDDAEEPVPKRMRIDDENVFKDRKRPASEYGSDEAEEPVPKTIKSEGESVVDDGKGSASVDEAEAPMLETTKSESESAIADGKASASVDEAEAPVLKTIESEAESVLEDAKGSASEDEVEVPVLEKIKSEDESVIEDGKGSASVDEAEVPVLKTIKSVTEESVCNELKQAGDVDTVSCPVDTKINADSD